MGFAVLLAFVGTTMAVVLHHPLIWRKSEMIEMIERGEYADFVKHHNALRSSSLITLGQRVLEYGDHVYLANITIGTPDQQFAVILDTGSSMFWVPGDACDPSCDGRHRFETDASSTIVESNKTWTIRYGMGTAKGVLGTDVMKFGGLNEQHLVVPNTTFGLAKQLSRFRNKLNDGVLGLGLSIGTDKAVPPLINAINQNLLDKPLFTVWLQNLRAHKGTPRGLFTYGAVDTKNCGPVIAYEPLTSATHYHFKISAIKMRNYTHTELFQAASDTGSTFIGGPKYVIDPLAETAGAVYSSAEQLYTIECEATPPTIDIIIGKNTYRIERNNYIFKIGSKKCYFAFIPLDFGGFGPDWILGRPFIHQFCNVFDIGQKRIGFAPSL